MKSVTWVLVLIYDHNKLKLNWTVFRHTNFISSLKHGDGNITVCACFVASILGQPSITGLWILNCPSKFYRKVTGYLFLKWSPRENQSCSKTTESTHVIWPKNGLKKNSQYLGWSSQCPDHNAIQMRKNLTCGSLSTFISKPICRIYQQLSETVTVTAAQEGTSINESKVSDTFVTNKYVALDHFCQ